jgi:hypothetical protein
LFGKTLKHVSNDFFELYQNHQKYRQNTSILNHLGNIGSFVLWFFKIFWQPSIFFFNCETRVHLYTTLRKNSKYTVFRSLFWTIFRNFSSRSLANV